MNDYLTEDEISALIDGTADAALMRRAAATEALRAQLNAARQREQALKGALYRFDCPPVLRLGDYALGRLPAPDADLIVRHLKLCALCRRELDQLNAGLMREIDVPAQDAPARYLPIRATTRPTYAAERAFGAALRGDDDQMQAQVVKTPQFELAIEARREIDGITLTGGILPYPEHLDLLDAWPGALVEVRQGGALRATAFVDDLGNFTCGGLLPDAAELRLVPEHGSAIYITLQALIGDD